MEDCKSKLSSFYKWSKHEGTHADKGLACVMKEHEPWILEALENSDSEKAFKAIFTGGIPMIDPVIDVVISGLLQGSSFWEVVTTGDKHRDLVLASVGTCVRRLTGSWGSNQEMVDKQTLHTALKNGDVTIRDMCDKFTKDLNAWRSE